MRKIYFVIFSAVLCAMCIHAKKLTMNAINWNIGTGDPPNNIENLLGIANKETPGLAVLAFQGVGLVDRIGKWKETIEKKLEVKQYKTFNYLVTEELAYFLFIPAQNERHFSTASTELSYVKETNLQHVSFKWHEKTIVVVTSHLPEIHPTDKFSHYKNIAKAISKTPGDFYFWLGDLDFSINRDKTDVKNDMTKSKFCTLFQLYALLKEGMRNQRGFVGWKEAAVNIKPTYKFQPGSNHDNWSNTPAGEDRILYKTSHKISVKTYESLDKYKKTEHKPVRATFYLHV